MPRGGEDQAAAKGGKGGGPRFLQRPAEGPPAPADRRDTGPEPPRNDHHDWPARCRDLEQQLLDLQELGRIGIWEWDFATRQATWSPLLRRMHGLPGDSPITARRILATVHPEDRSRVEDLLRGNGLMGDDFEMGYRVPRPEGRLLHMQARGQAQRDRLGRLRRLVGTAQDVTAQRQQDEIRERSFLASIVESSADAILTKDLDGTITSWNKAAETLFGYTADEIIGRPVTTLFPPERVAEERIILGRLLRGERVEHFETERMRKDGRRIGVAVTVSPLRDRDGRIVGASNMARDVTRQRQQRQRERQAVDAEIRRLEEMQRFRARFLNVAAHELKTPLTPIRLQLQLLAMQLTDQPQKVQRSLAILTRSVERLRNLMDDVLDAARVQAMQLKLRRGPTDLAAIVLEAMETYSEVANRVNVQMQLDLPGNVELEGDHARLLQVVNNLLSNAIKYTPPGGHVEVSLRTREAHAELTVADTGRGLSAQQREQLFRPFSQVHPDLEATSKGSGLGLFIVKAIVEQHGGAITIDSPGPDQGSTVTVRLPLTQDPAHRAHPARLPAEARQPDPLRQELD